MSAASIVLNRIALDDLAERFAPGRFRFDPFGFVTGYKTYQIYTGLAAKSDSELAALGLARADLPRVAVRAAEQLRRG